MKEISFMNILQLLLLKRKEKQFPVKSEPLNINI